MIVVVSDVHLAEKKTRGDRLLKDDQEFLDFLKVLRTDYLSSGGDLVLLGDVIDFWRRDFAKTLAECDVIFSELMNFDRDVKMLAAHRWPTLISRAQFEQVTREPDFPDYLKDDVNDDGRLPVFANGEMIYTLKGVHVRVTVQWNFQAPAGTGDTHYSVMRGTKANVIIRQGPEQGYRPELYVEPAPGADSVAEHV